ncbi:hypothetical protein C9J22_04340 [Photobacterium phosphoreum]|uniref:type VI secretion system-associated protein TagO n=1 Tax=Photobacterium phosphoreum TaxID=659 RepID=UPI000D172BF1|nr:type VI secretion system-associated protein TagO [Photobacterium phosphoreum]PSU73173.1 hypothetical protein C9J22_04340 [Photobacterium phosphoreum]
MFYKIIIASLVSFPLLATASVTDKDIAKCAVIDGDLARLECYDKIAKQNNLDGRQIETITTKGVGDWNVSTDVNPIDDSKTVTLILNANSGKSKWGKPIYLVARCQSNKTNVYINWGEYLGREAIVLTRIGNNKANTSKWGISTDSKATFNNKPITFLKTMSKSNKLVAQITPYNESPVTAIFDISGLDNALKPLRETCNW